MEGCSWYGKTAIHRYFHLFVALMYFSAIYGYYDLPCKLPYPDSPEQYAGFWKYLTYWNLIAQFLFFAFSCVTDTLKYTSLHLTGYGKMIKIRDIIYAAIVFPYGMLVSCLFWGIYAYNRELIFPEKLDGLFPAWLNHISHTVSVPVLCLEALIIHHHQFPCRKVAIATTLGFGGVYFLWILYLGFSKGIWVYIILEVLPWYGKVIFIIIAFILILIIYFVCEKINCCLWSFRSSTFMVERFHLKK